MTHTTKAIARVLALVAMLTFAAIAPASAISPATYESQAIKATNAYRASHGKVAVKQQACLDRWATGQAKWMASRGKLQHRKGRLAKVLKSCKLTGASENIAWNYSSGNKVVKAWSKSSGHARNMRSSKMRYIAVSAVRGKDGTWYVAQLFGTRK